MNPLPMKVAIIEDEQLAAERLEEMLLRQAPEAQVLAIFDSVKRAAPWLQLRQAECDLLFMDIQLADGLSFDIFDQVHVNTPVIFTTAYDEYAVRAFKVNSIDYLLKPIDEEELALALDKFKALYSQKQHNAPTLELLATTMQMMSRQYKKRFVIKIGEHIKTVETNNAHFFMSLEKATYLVTAQGKRYIIDFSLDQLDELLDPEVFFRVNRKFIVSMPAIADIIAWSNSRLKVVLTVAKNEEVVVSRDRVQPFRRWLDG